MNLGFQEPTQYSHFVIEQRNSKSLDSVQKT